MPAAEIGIVVIGRNEGGRLLACLESVRCTGCTAIYVDSGSSDESVAIAKTLGVPTLELRSDRPFSAARSRNEGFQSLALVHPGLKYVQFLDGDCTLADGWIVHAEEAHRHDHTRAAVVGHLTERNESASIYNRLCAIEWRSAPGDLQDYGRFGGISMMRADVLRAVGGFREDVIAGEDSELGVRIGLAGYRITKIDRPMAVHDAAMTHFGQWWRRAVRAGHAIGQRSDLNGGTPAKDCVRERNSTLFWGVGLPILILATLFPSSGVSAALLLAYPVLLARVWLHRRRLGESATDVLAYTLFILPTKFANAAGLLRFFINRATGRFEIIEYKRLLRDSRDSG